MQIGIIADLGTAPRRLRECKLLIMWEDLQITNRLFSTPASLGRANVPP